MTPCKCGGSCEGCLYAKSLVESLERGLEQSERGETVSLGSFSEHLEKERLIQINWPNLWCLVLFIVGFVAGRLW